jgi:hypothetical protein
MNDTRTSFLAPVAEMRAGRAPGGSLAAPVRTGEPMSDFFSKRGNYLRSAPRLEASPVEVHKRGEIPPCPKVLPVARACVTLPLPIYAGRPSTGRTALQRLT